MNDCPNCNVPMPETARFCRKCGFELLLAAPPSAIQKARPRSVVSDAPRSHAAIKPAALRARPLPRPQPEPRHPRPVGARQTTALARRGPVQPPLVLPAPEKNGQEPVTPAERQQLAEQLTEEVPASDLKLENATQAVVRENPESFSSTKQAAEQWRSSWIERQRQEAGPALRVSRGQAEVIEPLDAMQHSLARIRAVLLQERRSRAKKHAPRYWLQIILLLCALLVLTGYILSTYIRT